jgi:Ca2+-binding RTX toxin-like protein
VIVGDDSHTLNSIDGSLYVFGGTGTTDKLIVRDYGTATAKTFTMTTTGLSRTSMGTIKYAYSDSSSSGFETMEVKAGLGADTFKANSFPKDATVTFTGGNGSDTLIGNNTVFAWLPHFWSITATNAGAYNGMKFSSVENLRGGTASDLFIFDAGKSVSGDVNGGGGVDALDFSAYTTDLYVNLATGAATGAGGGVTSVEQVSGGSGNDILVGNSGVNLLKGNGGRDILIGGFGADTLNGGAGDDILVAGATTYDADATALNAIRDQWKIPYLWYSTRLNNLTNGVGASASVKLTAANTPSDPAADKLTGGDGTDWYFANYAEITDELDYEQVGALL